MLADIEWRPKVLVKRVLLAANAAPVADYAVAVTADELIFSGQMLSSKQPVVISLKGTRLDGDPPAPRRPRPLIPGARGGRGPPSRRAAAEPFAGKTKVAVNCEDMVLCPTILKAVKLSVTAK